MLTVIEMLTHLKEQGATRGQLDKVRSRLITGIANYDNCNDGSKEMLPVVEMLTHLKEQGATREQFDKARSTLAKLYPFMVSNPERKLLPELSISMQGSNFTSMRLYLGASVAHVKKILPLIRSYVEAESSKGTKRSEDFIKLCVNDFSMIPRRPKSDRIDTPLKPETPIETSVLIHHDQQERATTNLEVLHRLTKTNISQLV